MEDFYELLGLSRSASLAEIEAACLRVGASLREEVEGDAGGMVKEKFKLVERAFETLTNSESRSAYDASLLHLDISKSLDAIIENAALESMPPSSRREGILGMAVAISLSAVVVVAAVVKNGAGDLILTIFGTTFQFFQDYEYRHLYLIEIPASILQLFCFLIFVYGVLVFLAVLPRPSVLWKRLHKFLSP